MIVLIRNPITYDSKIPCVDQIQKTQSQATRVTVIFILRKVSLAPEKDRNEFIIIFRISEGSPVSTGRNSEPTKQ
ncbi:hypothetical protein BWD14_05275 [Leptospira santarosai]|uniref:Uncharacterized protein n=2 Tax=Leptospira santarosai TaxID=28183 RepID=A0AB73N307_9LEPT|nr:hypothetical protein LEP1GSC179_0180 [Leptospira santarosai str. MOR084]ONF94037.1 hypothetical protein BWD14_05275 [Leptospira santarosai]